MSEACSRAEELGTRLGARNIFLGGRNICWTLESQLLAALHLSSEDLQYPLWYSLFWGEEGMRVAASVFIGITTALTLSMDVLAIERNYVAVIYKNAFLPVPPSREFNTMARLTVSTLKPFDTAEECVEFGREQIFKYESVPDEYRDMMIDGDRPFSNPNANFSWVADCFKDEGGEFRSFWRETGPVY